MSREVWSMDWNPAYEILMGIHVDKEAVLFALSQHADSVVYVLLVVLPTAYTAAVIGGRTCT